ncbi:hypothetical protein PSA5_21205 [Pseudomonas syringae pv. actinidiae]|nr:hypothetical protein PSA5_21205 [Pseudomonas syringae pv. actinidiae]
MILQKRFRGRGFVAALIGNFERHSARPAGQSRSATAQRTGQANVVVILTLKPEQRAAAGILRRADADLAVDLPAVKAAQLLLVFAPLRGVTLALNASREVRPAQPASRAMKLNTITWRKNITSKVL